ncbi:hypothetical protein BSL82_09630 [Tardibacter chloracetimidivorans]|uniref:HNH nuclease domain-containing protein n=1 Tax=Tardibacter chloracetimidivorans TaxID=1921510 RepID=A0A1L3ZV75_9SPHN|nr:HNH endonuclease signature motif containing protein [Tardibacter chloracetimidivorans]API59541.1 hypothetical protein BSL82_09630 [Tardibacter chloracetimidivorans]
MSYASRRRSAWKRQTFLTHPRCEYCKRDIGLGREFGLRQATVDHIVARRDGGADNPSNWALVCLECNQVKADRPFDPGVLTGVVSYRRVAA